MRAIFLASQQSGPASLVHKGGKRQDATFPASTPRIAPCFNRASTRDTFPREGAALGVSQRFSYQSGL